MKIYPIKDCCECPHFESEKVHNGFQYGKAVFYHISSCYHDDFKEAKTLPRDKKKSWLIKPIPEWCPLEDAPEKPHKDICECENTWPFNDLCEDCRSRR